MKRVLVLNGNYSEIGLINAFHKLGHYVITTGNRPDLVGHQYADQYVAHDYSDYVGLTELARELKIDYVAACTNDIGVTTAAYIAEQLGLPGHDTYLNSRIISEKDLFKRFAQENGLQVIPAREFDEEAEAERYVASAAFPIIVKPNDLFSGKGVSRADSVDEGVTAVYKAFAMSRSKHIVIEPYIEGTQHSICTFLVNRKVATYTTFNEMPEPNNPFLVGYGTLPADDMPQDAPLLIEQIEKMASLLGLADGIFHMQYRLDRGKPYIMECMRRNLGNYSLQLASYGLGLDWEEWIAKSYCGMDCSSIPQVNDTQKHLGAYWVQPPRNGRIKDVWVDPVVEQFLVHKIDNWHEGMEITNYHDEKVSYMWFEFPDREQKERYMERIVDYVSVIMED